MSHACHRFWKCYKTLTFCSLLTRCAIPRACHAKRHLNVQKCAEPVSLLHFWLRHVLRARTACTFSTSQLPKSGLNMVCFVYFDLETCLAPQRRAIFHLSSGQLAWPAYFSTLRLHKSLGKQCFATFLPFFSRAWIFFLLKLSLFLIFFLLLFSSLTLPISAFHLSILSEV